MTETVVYRLYGDLDKALYVGITGNVATRFAHHRSTRHWWPLVRRFELQEYASRDEARLAEQAAIDELAPEYNRIRAHAKTPMRAFRCEDAIWDAVQDYAEATETTNTAVVVQALREFLEREAGR